MASRDDDPYDGAFFRISCRVTKEDVTTLNEEAKQHGMTLGYYLDLILAFEANRLRMRDGLPQLPWPMMDATTAVRPVWPK